MKQKSVIVIAILVLWALISHGQSITGMWKKYSKKTGDAVSLIDLYLEDGKLYGKISDMLAPKKDNSETCKSCPESGKFSNKGKTFRGLHIIKGLQKEDEGIWEGENGILDPLSGRIYDCKMWIDEDNPNLLKVRGYIGFIFKTITLYRAQDISQN